ncbi:MAG TPA: sulfite exporter TauE/SafE family protein [Candidatus Limnocylindria bacterium]|nr:sulfite exporter TauE/SafE family protein [Candidatus Limnocylindria bacterium]
MLDGAAVNRTTLILVAIGVAAGILSGLFGVGGGILMVPAMVLLAGFAQQRAQATSLAAIVPIAAVGALIFGRADNVDLLAAAILVAGSLLGVQAGAWLMHRTSDERLSTIFGIFLAAVAVTLLLP